jgi:hypothetical protein
MHRLTKTARMLGAGAAWLLALVLLALVFTPDARAQDAPPTSGELQCLPKQEGGAGSDAVSGWSLNGWWAWWWCPHADGAKLTLIVGTPEVLLRNIGDRLTTIRNAPDKLPAARAAWRRHVTRPISDPIFDRVRADCIAHIRSTPNFGR